MILTGSGTREGLVDDRSYLEVLDGQAREIRNRH